MENIVLKLKNETASLFEKLKNSREGFKMSKEGIDINYRNTEGILFFIGVELTYRLSTNGKIALESGVITIRKSKDNSEIKIGYAHPNLIPIILAHLNL